MGIFVVTTYLQQNMLTTEHSEYTELQSPISSQLPDREVIACLELQAFRHTPTVNRQSRSITLKSHNSIATMTPTFLERRHADTCIYVFK